MTRPRAPWDPWALPNLLLWLVFLLVGLAPEPIYEELRRASLVVTQNALVNSPGIITVAFSSYVAVFGFTRSHECGLTWSESWSRAVLLGVLALVAFIPYTLEDWESARLALVPGNRRLLYTVGPLKMASWLYLLFLVTRHYVFGNHRAFPEAFWPLTSHGSTPQRGVAESPAPGPAAAGALGDAEDDQAG